MALGQPKAPATIWIQLDNDLHKIIISVYFSTNNFFSKAMLKTRRTKLIGNLHLGKSTLKKKTQLSK